MSASESQQSRIADTEQPVNADKLRSGSGAASAMERVRAERVMRRRHQHGTFTASAFEEDQVPRR